MMDEAVLAALKAHCRVDHDDDDALLESYYSAAIHYLEGAGVEMPESPLYELAVKGLVAGWYDGEEFNSGVTVGTRQIINQLKLSASGGGVA